MGPRAWDMSMARVFWHESLLDEDQDREQVRTAQAAGMAWADEKAWKPWAAERLGTSGG